jgi:hypothetical protein
LNQPTAGTRIITGFGTVMSTDSATSNELAWLLSDLRCSPGIEPGAGLDVRVDRHVQPWDHWSVSVDGSLVEPAVDRVPMFQIVLEQLDSAARAGRLAITGSAVQVGSRCVLLVGPDSLDAAVIVARSGGELLTTGFTVLAGSTARYVVSPHVRPVSRIDLARIGRTTLDVGAEGAERPLPWAPVSSLDGVRMATRPAVLNEVIIHRPGSEFGGRLPLSPADLVAHVADTDRLVAEGGSAAFHRLAALARSVPASHVDGGSTLELASLLIGATVTP